MKNLLYFVIAGMFALPAYSQSITESKDGTNSILLNGTAITLKITDPTLRLDLQREKLFKNSRNNGYLFGISAEGSNQSGIAGVFNEGELVPGGKITGLAGFTFSNNIIKKPQQRREEIRAKELSIRKRIEELTSIKQGISSDGANAIDAEIKAIVENELMPVLKAGQEQADTISKISYYKISLFGFGGVAAKTFRHFIQYDQTNLLASFRNENFRGGNIGLGVNAQYRNWQFGATLAHISDDNQAYLLPRTYTWEKTTTVGTQTLKETRTITAYAGEYAKVKYLSFNTDVVANISLDHVKTAEQPRNYMLINPYAHFTLNSDNKDLLPNTTNVGLGLYVFNSKSKLLGGLYVELPDVDDKIEKSKVAADRSIRPALQKLSFGIVTRFNFQSFIRFQNL